MIPRILAEDAAVNSTTKKAFSFKAEKAALTPCAAATCCWSRKLCSRLSARAVGVHTLQPVTDSYCRAEAVASVEKPQARPPAHGHHVEDSLETPVAALATWACYGKAPLSPGGGGSRLMPQGEPFG